MPKVDGKSKLARETEYFVSAMKILAAEAKFDEIVTLTEDKIEWGKSARSKFKVIIKEAGDQIVRSRYGYYIHANFYKSEQEKTNPVDQAAPAKESMETLRNFVAAVSPILPPSKTEKPKLRSGDLFEGYISGIEPYGVFVENGSMRLSGLIHKTNMNDGNTPPSFDQIRTRFRLGDILRARVLSFNPTTAKLGLTLRGLNEPAVVVQSLPAPHVAPPASPPQTAPVAAEKPILNPTPVKEETNVLEETQFEELFTYIRSKVGHISPQARLLLEDLARQHGQFKFMLGMTRAVESFDVDMGLLFAREIEKKLGE